MSVLTPPPGHTVVQGQGTFGNGIPNINDQESATVIVTGCAHGQASLQVIAPATSPTGQPHTITTSGPVGEELTTPGTYVLTIPRLAPFHFTGPAQITTTITCGSTVQRGSFSVYIDPSGFVVDTAGHPIHGATVALFRSDLPGGPYAAVPNGSAIMAPNNRNNPSLTDVAGVFGWDVLSGYYSLVASHPGCGAAAGSGVLPVPPPATGIKLTLNCPNSTLTHAKLKKQRKGKLKLRFSVNLPGNSTIKSVFVLKKKGRKQDVSYGADVVKSNSKSGRVTVTITPKGSAAKLLHKHKHKSLQVVVTLTWESTYGAVLTKTLNATVH
jgi:hypothetical protein